VFSIHLATTQTEAITINNNVIPHYMPKKRNYSAMKKIFHLQSFLIVLIALLERN